MARPNLEHLAGQKFRVLYPAMLSCEVEIGADGDPKVSGWRVVMRDEGPSFELPDGRSGKVVGGEIGDAVAAVNETPFPKEAPVLDEVWF